MKKKAFSFRPFRTGKLKPQVISSWSQLWRTPIPTVNSKHVCIFTRPVSDN